MYCGAESKLTPQKEMMAVVRCGAKEVPTWKTPRSHDMAYMHHVVVAKTRFTPILGEISKYFPLRAGIKRVLGI